MQVNVDHLWHFQVKVIVGLLAPLDQREAMVHREMMDLKDLEVKKEIPVMLVQYQKQVQREISVTLVRQARMETRVNKVHKVPQGTLEQKEVMDQVDDLEIQ